MQGIGKHHSTTHERRVLGHSLLQGLYVLLQRRCPLPPRLYRQQHVCEREQVPFQSKIDLMIELIQSFEPVAGTLTHVLLDSWYSAKVIWKAARERGFLITTGLKCNRSLRIEDSSHPTGWRWQRLDTYAASLSTEQYTQLCWPRGEESEPVYVHVVSTRVRKLSSCQVVIVRRSLDDPISQARYWASSDLEAEASRLLEHISARWDIEVLFADGKEELGLDQYQLMSATALVRALRAWPCLPTPFLMKNGIACRSNGNALSPLVKRVVRSNDFIDASFSSGFVSSSNKEPLTSLCLNSSPLSERSFGKVQS